MVEIIRKALELYLYKTGVLLYFSKPDPPPPPDYAGAARAQGAANEAAARISGRLSNPNFSNPLGTRNVTFGYNGDPDQVFVEDKLTPLGQQRFDQEQRINSQLGQVAEEGIGRVRELLGSPFDMTQVQNRPDLNNTLSRDQVTQSIIDRNQPMMDRRRQQMETQLSNQGIFRGSEAYQNAIDDIAREENDFRLGAIQAGGAEQSRQYGLESAARQNDVQTQQFLRSLPLNEINALRSGSQVMMPQFQQYQGQDVAPAPMFSAAQAQDQANMSRYNAQQAGSGGLMNGLFGLGSAFAGSGAGSKMIAGMFSDARLKENIQRVGKTEGGLPIYTYNYIGSPVRQMGVMAQEVEKVMPDAVLEHESGYKMVDYSKVK